MLVDLLAEPVPHWCGCVVTDRPRLLRDALGLEPSGHLLGSTCVEDGNGVRWQAMIVAARLIKGPMRDCMNEFFSHVELGNYGGGRRGSIVDLAIVEELFLLGIHWNKSERTRM